MEPRRRFRFLKELAAGGFGKVYLAEMVTGDNFSSAVAVKLLHGQWLDNDEVVMRSRDEARLLGRLRHRSIVRVEDLTSINGQCAVVMEFLEGVDCKHVTNWLKDHGRNMPRQAAFELLGAAASALDAAYNHRPIQGGDPLRVIHRDIKPSNIMLTAEGEVKVLDFGTARANFEDREARTQALSFGSQAYMAPERMLAEPDTPAGDIFSLGVTLYELLTLDSFGKIFLRPDRFEKSLEERLERIDWAPLPAEVRDETAEAMRMMLAYEPTGRPSATQVTELMEAFADHARDSTLKRFMRDCSRDIMESIQHEQDPNDPLTGKTITEDVFSAGSVGSNASMIMASNPARGATPPPAVRGATPPPAVRGSNPPPGLRSPTPPPAPRGATPAPTASATPAPSTRSATPPPASRSQGVSPPPTPSRSGPMARSTPSVPPTQGDAFVLANTADAPPEPEDDENPFQVPPELMASPESEAGDARVAAAADDAAAGQAFGLSSLTTSGGAGVAAGVASAAEPGRVHVQHERPLTPAPRANPPSLPPSRTGPASLTPRIDDPSRSRSDGIRVGAGKADHADSDEAPEPARGGFGKIIGAVLMLMVLGGGALVAGAWYLLRDKTGTVTDETPIGATGETPAGGGAPAANLPSGAAEADFSPNAAGKGGVVLSAPDGASKVAITSTMGFKTDWDGSGFLRLRDMEPGSYRAKVSPKGGGTPVFSEFRIEADTTCAQRYQNGAWEKSECN